MFIVKRTIVSAAGVLALLAAAPLAHADCCDSATPTAGAFAISSGQAFLPLDRVELETDQPVRHNGALAALRADGTVVGPRSVPSMPFQDVSRPVLSVVPTSSAAWVQAPDLGAPAGSRSEVRTGAVAADAQVTTSVLVGTTATPDAQVGLVGAPDGSRLVVWRDGAEVHARRVASGDALGPAAVVTNGLSAARFVRVAGDLGGGAVVVWHEGSRLYALRVPVGTDPAAASEVDLGAVAAADVLAVETDGAGGVNVVTRSGGSNRVTRLVQLPSGAAAPTATVIARSASGLSPSAALSPGAVAYLAKGKAGRPDVFVRILMPSSPPRGGVNVSRTSTSETAVSAVALGVGERRVVLYTRRPKGQSRTDLLLRPIAVFSKTPGTERNLSATTKATESAGRLAVAIDGTVYAAWTSTRSISSDTGSYACGVIAARVVTPGGTLKPVRKLADCAVTSSS